MIKQKCAVLLPSYHPISNRNIQNDLHDQNVFVYKQKILRPRSGCHHQNQFRPILLLKQVLAHQINYFLQERHQNVLRDAGLLLMGCSIQWKVAQQDLMKNNPDVYHIK